MKRSKTKKKRWIAVHVLIICLIAVCVRGENKGHDRRKSFMYGYPLKPVYTSDVELKDGLPALKYSLEEVKRGACTEDLGCELECELHGNQALVITLPLPELDEYLENLSERPTYMRAE